MFSVSINTTGTRVILGGENKFPAVYNINLTKKSKNDSEITDSNTVDPQLLHGHSSSINSVKICSNPQFAITGSDDNNTILWNLETRESVKV